MDMIDGKDDENHWKTNKLCQLWDYDANQKCIKSMYNDYLMTADGKEKMKGGKKVLKVKLFVRKKNEQNSENQEFALIDGEALGVKKISFHGVYHRVVHTLKTMKTITMKTPKKEKRKNDLIVQQPIVDSFYTLFNSDKFKSYSLNFGYIRIDCHPCVLTQSKVLKEAIQESEDNEDNEITVQSDDIIFRVEDVIFVIQWLYGKVPEVKDVNFNYTLKIAKKIKLPFLVDYIFSVSDISPTKEDQQCILDDINNPRTPTNNILIHVSDTLFKEVMDGPRFTTNFIFLSNDGVETYVHREVLAINSRFFQDVLFSDEYENLNKMRLFVSDKCVKLLVRYYYVNKEIGDGNAIDYGELLTIAYRFEEDDLNARISKKLIKKLNKRNVLEFFLRFNDLVKENDVLKEDIINKLQKFVFCKNESLTNAFLNEYFEKKEADVLPQACEFLFKMKEIERKRNMILHELKKKKIELNSFIENLKQKKSDSLKVLLKVQKENSQLQYGIAKESSIYKQEKQIKELEEEMKGLKDGSLKIKKDERLKSIETEIENTRQFKVIKKLKEELESLDESDEVKKNKKLEEIQVYEESLSTTLQYRILNALKMDVQSISEGTYEGQIKSKIKALQNEIRDIESMTQERKEYLKQNENQCLTVVNHQSSIEQNLLNVTHEHHLISSSISTLIKSIII